MLAQVAHTAWMYDEEKYDNLVFGYYAIELQRMLNSKGKLQRADVGIWVRLPDKGGLLKGEGPARFEASGVAWLDRGGFDDPLWLVANDNSSHLTIHNLNGDLVQVIDLCEKQLCAEQGIMDIEEIAPGPDGSFYLLGSHSTYNQAEDVRRQRLVRIHLDYSASEKRYKLRKSFEEIDLTGHLENTCIDSDKRNCLRRGWKEAGHLKCCEINIEAMAVSPDGRELYLGFREPIICNGKKPVTRIYRLSLERHRKDPGAELEPVGEIPADLQSHGFPGPVRISGMAYDQKRESYQVLASYERDNDPDGRNVPPACSKWPLGSDVHRPERGGALWTWEGTLEEKPALQSITSIHKPEGIAIHPKYGVVIVFDNDHDSDLDGARTPLAFFSRSGLPGKRCAPLIPAPTNE